MELDPALSATVLRMANSPYFGVSGRVGGARQAVVMLGVKSVGSLAVSRTASLVFSEDDTTAPAGYWTHSIATAVACAVIAPFAGVADDEAFTAGLLHDIGSLVLHNDDDATKSESSADHVAFSAEMLARWGLPRPTISAIRLLTADPSLVHEPLGRVLLARALLGDERHRGRPSALVYIDSRRTESCRARTEPSRRAEREDQH